MQIIDIDPYSVCTVPIDVLINGSSAAVATGFFYKYEENIWLISNWHVFSGCSVLDGSPLHGSNMSPEQFEFLAIDANNHGANRSGKINLTRDGRSLWIQHPKGREIDVAAIRLNGLEGYFLTPVNEVPSAADMRVTVSDDVFILGYPRAVSKQGPIPVWKRGSIASEPGIPIDGASVFLVDSTTSKGMSGAPVIARSHGGYSSKVGHRNLGHGPFSKFLGVYSGRYGHNNTTTEDALFTTGLGKVWSESLLVEMLKWTVPGKAPISYE